MKKGLGMFILGWSLLMGWLCLPEHASAITYKIGDRVEFGHQAGKPILWDVVNVDQNGNPLLFSNEILAWKAYDAGEVLEDGERSDPQNRWSTSTLRQWLNSEEETISWTDGIPDEEGIIPSHLSYAKESGFLRQMFSPAERAAVLEVKRQVPIDEADQAYRSQGSEHPSYEVVEDRPVLLNEDAVFRELVSDRVFIVSIDEVSPFFKKYPEAVSAPVSASIQEEPYRKTHEDAYWTIAPGGSNDVLLSMDINRFMYGYHANEGIGVRPAFYLDKEKLDIQSGDGSHKSPYSAIPTSITFKLKALDIRVGFGQELEYEIVPEDHRPKLRFISSDPSIASVNSNGVVMGKRSGTVTISMISSFGQTAKSKIRVTENRYIPKLKTSFVEKNQTLDGNIDSYDHYLSKFNSLAGGTSLLRDEVHQMHVVYETENVIRVVVYDRLLKVIKRISIKKEWSRFGDITLDPSGNYYVLLGKVLTEKDHKSASIRIVKYDSNGKRVKSTSWNGKTLDTKVPFDAGNARIMYHEGRIVAHFARKMFVHSDGLNHQASQNVYLNPVTMKAISPSYKPYVSHSFNQALLPLRNGGLIFADHGDAYYRGFVIHYMKGEALYSFTPFHFREGEDWAYGYNATFAQLGGVAEGKDGFALLGASEKTLSAAPAKSYRNESRNLFLQFFKTDIEAYEDSENMNDYFLVKGTPRPMIGTRPKKGSGRYFLDAKTKDLNVRWITAYTKNQDVAYPKIISTDDGRYIVMWEEFVKERFKRVHMRIYASHGEALTPVIDIPDARLPIAEDIVYHQGSVYWTTVTTSSSRNMGYLKLHQLKVD